MATATRTPLGRALRIWNDIRHALAPDCERLELAGSARRGRPEVKDLEAVAIPRFREVPDENDLYRRPRVANCLQAHIERMARMGMIRLVKNGTRYMAFDWLLDAEPLRVDLFTATVETWPTIYMVRTGPAQFNMMILQRAREKGYRILWGTGIYNADDVLNDRGRPRPRPGATAIPVASEADIFALLDMDYIPPEKRE